MGDNTHILEQRLKAVAERIRAAERAADRPAGSVRLLAVSKGQSAEAVRAVAALGHRCFGESYLQEALEKRESVAETGLEWHFIGPIQANKTRGIAEHFDWVQSVDRDKILKRLDEQRSAHLPPLNICLQVNISGESRKAGAGPGDLAGLADAAADSERLRLRGVMTIPAPSEDPDELRAAFARTRALFEDLKARGHDLDTLSMGMTADLELAVAEGANMVRLGTAVFGPRQG